MGHRSLLITLLALAMVAALATAALAGKPENPGKPTTTTTTAVTITTVPGYWTCQARVDNGAVAWEPLGTYDETTGFYTGDGPVLCVDIIEKHRDVTDWTVEWSGTTAKGTVKGLKLVFEEEVHGTVYDEAVFQSESGTTESGTAWNASWSTADVQNLVFVAMPHSGDKWIGPMTFTITPLSGGHDG